MKQIVLFLVLTFSTLSAVATQPGFWVRSWGEVRQYCSHNDWSCERWIEDRAERRAIDEAGWYCRSQGGFLREYTARCFNNCRADWAPPGSNGTWVTCRANCDTLCERR